MICVADKIIAAVESDLQGRGKPSDDGRSAQERRAAWRRAIESELAADSRIAAAATTYVDEVVKTEGDPVRCTPFMADLIRVVRGEGRA